MKKEIRQKVYAKFGNRCAYCGQPIEYKDMQVDHIHAKYNGGANDIDNYNPSCRMCNYYKQCATIDDFRGYYGIGGIIERLRKTFLFRMAEKYGLIEVKEWDGKFYFEKVESSSKEKEE